MNSRNLVAAFAVLVALSAPAAAQDIRVNTSADVRLVTEPSGARDDNNGGDTTSGALIGINPGAVDNFLVFEFDDLSPVAGQSVTGATVRVFVNTAFSNPNHGQATDMISLNEIAAPNAGWTPGTGEITGADTPPDNGSISFLNRVQFNGSGTSEPWLDAAGNPAANLLSTLTELSVVPGYDVGTGPATLDFAIDAVTAQSWVDAGTAGFVLRTIDDGDFLSRFNMGVNAMVIDFELPAAIEELTPESFSIANGTLNSGGVAELALSDNSDVSSSRSGQDIQARITIELKTTTTNPMPTSIELTVEGSVFARSTITQAIDMFDYNLGVWEEVNVQNASPMIDGTVMVTPTGDLSRFVDPVAMCLETRIRFTSGVQRQNFTSNLDHVLWVVE